MIVSRDVNKIYLDKKKKIKEGLEERKNSNHHKYIDINSKYKLHGDHGSLPWYCIEATKNEYVIFFQITDYEGVAIGKFIEKCLNEWGIDKIFVFTVHNASSNERTVAHFKMDIGEKNGEIMLGVKFAHMRCCAHIVNLIVNDGLKEKHISICNIRNKVRYVRSSPLRLNFLQRISCIEKHFFTLGVVHHIGPEDRASGVWLEPQVDALEVKDVEFGDQTQ